MCSNTDIDCKKYIIRVFEIHAYSLLRHEQSSFSNLSVTSPTSQLILRLFRRLTYVTAHSPTLPLLHLRHSSYSNPSFASPTSQALHSIHLASRPCIGQLLDMGSSEIWLRKLKLRSPALAFGIRFSWPWLFGAVAPRI